MMISCYNSFFRQHVLEIMHFTFNDIFMQINNEYEYNFSFAIKIFIGLHLIKSNYSCLLLLQLIFTLQVTRSKLRGCGNICNCLCCYLTLVFREFLQPKCYTCFCELFNFFADSGIKLKYDIIFCNGFYSCRMDQIIERYERSTGKRIMAEHDDHQIHPRVCDSLLC